ncbi:unnamed protein product, partial [Adineta steineri]
MYDSGVITKDDYSMVYSGAPSSNKTRSAHGVAIYLDKHAASVWRESGAKWEAVSIIAVYSPINPNGSKQATEESNAFYAKLQQTVDKVPRGDMLLILGDFNARVGKQQNLTSKNVIGPHAVDKINENGKQLIDFCSHNELIVSNTFYQHKAVHQMTWKHPATKKWHMLDYTLVNKKFRSSVEDVRVFRNAAGAIGTDHHLTLSGAVFHNKQNKSKKPKEWLTDEILSLVDEKGAAFVEWQNHSQTRMQRKYRNKYYQLRNLVNKKIRARRLEFWDEVSEEIEKAIKQHDPSTAYRMIRQLKGGRTNVDNMPIRNKQGDLLSESEDVMVRWSEYFCELLNVHSIIDPHIIQQIPIPSIPTIEQVRQDIPPSLSEVVGAIKQMKNRKAPGVDNISADVLKAGGVPMAKWVHEI